MGPWDDVEIDADGDELLDWLWDYPERYDVGIDGDPSGSVPAPAGAASGVRKHVRPADDPNGPPVPPAPVFDDRPTLAIDTYEARQAEETATGYPDWAGYETRASRYSARDVAAVAAVLLVVAVGLAVGYSLFKGSGKTPKPSQLAVAGPSTTIFNQSLIPPLDTTPSTADTTTSIPTTTVPTSTSVAGAAVGATTSTTRRCTAGAPNCTTTTVAVTTTTTTTTVAVTTTTTTMTTTTMPTTTTSTPASTTTLPGSTTTVSSTTITTKLSSITKVTR